MREVTVPALESGLSRAGRKLSDFEISYPAMIVTGNTEQEMDAAKTAVKAQLAFYGSTPAYRPVLDLHGWGDLQTELNALSKKGEWAQMAQMIDDDVVDAFAVVGPPDEIPNALLERYGDIVTRITFYAPYRLPHDQLMTLIAGFRSG